MAKKELEKGNLSIHTENIFPIIKKWLYSEHDIFSRELISNAVDALNKRQATDPGIKKEDLRVIVEIDKKKKTIQFIDYGIGMTAEEIEKYINQIAFSGAEDFIEKFKDKQHSIIGHFGLGFYSSFMVSDKVTIDSLSWQEGAKPAYWECDGTTEYSIGEGKRKEPGTTVTLHLNNDSKEYLDFSKMRELIEKYSNFTPFPIELEKKVINQKEALWNRKPKDVEDKEYTDFYKEVFHDYIEPMFWIHLNVDFPFNLKGILYFPRFRNQMEMQRGEIKLYCNNVFVADNLKEFVPEFLMTLRGGIDVPDIPLNVSRSFLQQDNNVRKISKYIIKKVADYLNDLFKADRTKYEEYWEHLHHFLKFGVLTEETFYEAAKSIIIYKTVDGGYVTLDEYFEKSKSSKSEEKPAKEDKKDKKDDVRKIYYASDEDTQITYIKMLKDAGKEVIIADEVIDNHVFQHLEVKMGDVSFVRIDSELDEMLIDSEKKELVDADNKTEIDHLKELFEKALDDKHITVEVKRLKNKDIPTMIVFHEGMRRMQEIQSFMKNTDKQTDFLMYHNLIVNAENRVVKKILKLKAKGKDEDAALLCKYLHNLSMLEQKKLTGDKFNDFVNSTHKILELI